MVEQNLEDHRCEFCPRVFGSSIGLGVHQQQVHRADYDRKVQAMEVGDVKVRWSREEVFLLASKEVELKGERFMNLALAPHFPERSAEAIKGKRKLAE